MAKQQDKKKKYPGIPPRTLRAHLKRGQIAPLYVLAGPERFLADEALQAIAAAVEQRDGAYSRNSFRGDETDLATVLDCARTPDLFSPARLVVVSQATGFVRRHAASLAAYAARPASRAYLVLVTDKIDGRTKLAAAAQKLGGLVACRPVYAREVASWITGRVRETKRQIDPPAAALLADFIGTDLGLLAAELDKLAIFLGDRTRITVADVEAVSLRDRGRIIFELTDALGSGNTAQTLIVFNRLVDQRQSVTGMLYMVARHIRRLWAVKESIARGDPPRVAARNAGVNFYVEQFLQQVSRFDLAQLRRSCTELVRCEAALKGSFIISEATSSDDQQVLLETALIRLTEVGRRNATL